MSKTIKEERLKWVLPIVNKEIKLKDAAKVFPHGKRTLERWVAAYKREGEAGLEPKSTRPKTNPKETLIRIKERTIEIRRETDKAALKIKWDLKKEGVFLHERTVGKFIKAEGLTRKYRVRKIRYQYIKAELKPGEIVEIDIKYVPKRLGNLRFYQFTAIDCKTRWRYMEIKSDMGNGSAITFLNTLVKIAPFSIKAIKTDNGSCFTNRYTGYLKSGDPINPRLHPLDLACQRLGIDHYLIDPGKPAQNGKVERSHRSDQEAFYEKVEYNTPEELKLKIRLWNMYYNDLEHCGLNGKTPNQMIKEFLHY